MHNNGVHERNLRFVKSYFTVMIKLTVFRNSSTRIFMAENLLIENLKFCLQHRQSPGQKDRWCSTFQNSPAVIYCRQTDSRLFVLLV